MELFKIENLSFKYPLEDKKALEDVSFSVNKGDFTVVCGGTGSGKTTLLRLLKKELSPVGEKQGRVYYCGELTEELSDKISCGEIGFVMQSPEQQIVTDKVWHELAFGLENSGTPREIIARRVAEIACYFGIEDWYEKKTSELSGGQKQLLNLAAVMVMNPAVIILDEPTSRLDPIAASNFISTLKKLNDDFSLTVIISEHRLEELIPICDRLVVLERGMLKDEGCPRQVVSRLCCEKNQLTEAMPAAVRLFQAVEGTGECPFTVKEGRRFAESFGNDIRSLPCEDSASKNKERSVKKALEFRNVYFRYDRELPDVLRGLEFSVLENEVFCILGGNGAGKTTAMMAAMGFLRPYDGQIRVFEKKLRDYKGQALFDNCVAFLPQNPQTLFLKDTVAEELAGDASDLPFDVTHLFNKHPYDLSGGEQQLVALAKVLKSKPRLLLADEPTKGLDAGKKREIGEIFVKLKEQGVTVVMVTHDTEFAANYADRCGMFFRGNLVSVGKPGEFFSENNFYTTAASRMTKGHYDGAVTVEDAAKLCLMNGKLLSGEEKARVCN